ncbi:damage-inducible protein DinB [Paenibacillus sp. D9]|uniref:DinB family protein n=1 Tax=Paenibacillus TaxID=44249 RepID=UPI00061EB63B|nr:MULTISPECIES: DinB family protein [Paenibacillus]KKC47499.1 damage-inducible protein DinB [Paenibacillus sp. D9]
MTDINGFIAEWRSHRNVLPQMLEQVTDEQLGMKPWEKAMSLSELVVHIAGSMVMFAATVANGAYMPGGKPASVHTADELRAFVASTTERAEELLRSIGGEQLERQIDFFGNAMPGHVLLQNAKDHEIHHKGQLFVYLRLAGIEQLPFFVSRG